MRSAKLVRRLLGGLLLFVPCLALFLAATEPGLRCLVALISELSGGAVSIGSVSGTLLGPLHLGQCRYADGIDTVEIEALHLHWTPRELLQGQLKIDDILVDRMKIIIGESSGETVLPSLSLPFSLVVARVQANDLVILSEQEEVLHLPRGTLTDTVFAGEQLNLTSFSLTMGDSILRGHGTLLTNTQYRLNATLEADLHLQGYEAITASAQATGPLNALQVVADMKSPQSIHLDGEIRDLLGTTTWSATFQAEEIHLPAFNPDWPSQIFRQATVQSQGTLEEYSLVIDAATGLPGLAQPVTLKAEIQGNGQGMAFSKLHLGQNKAALSAQGSLQWQPHLTWQADIQGTNLDPSVFFAQWPGHFAGKLTTKGEWADSPTATFQLAGLQGTLRNYPLSGQGEMLLQGQHLVIPQFLLTSGGSTLTIKGDATSTLDFPFSLHSGNLGELWPGAGGNLDLKGRVRGTPERPTLDMHLGANRLQFERNTVDHLTVTGKGVVTADGPVQVDIEINKATLGTFRLDRGHAEVRGTLAEHTLKVEGRNQTFFSAGELQGKLSDDQWQGNIKNIQVNEHDIGNWRQHGLSRLVLSPQQIDLQQLCVRSDPHASLCLDGSWSSPSQTWQFKAGLSGLPLSLLTEKAGISWPLTGEIHGLLQVQGKQQQIASGKLSCETREMQLTMPAADEAQRQWSWQRNSLHADYASGQLRLELLSELDAHNALRAEIRQSSPDLIAGLLQRPIQGSVELNMQDLRLISLLTNQAVIPSGNLNGKWTITGPPLTPNLVGQMDLIDGKADIPALGITIAPLHLAIKGNATTVELAASAKSGGGELRATSTIALARAAQHVFQVHLNGDNFQAVHLPSLDLTLSPELTFTAAPKQMELRGKIHIPHAKIASIDFDTATAPSADVVFIDEEQHETADVAVPINMALTIIAGKDVAIDAHGLRGNITGQLDVAAQPGRPPTGNGTLAVNNGSFSLYGNRLAIDVGRLLYSGGPLTNPGIELRSEQKTEKATAGVVIDGFLNHPEITFYSTPAMEQSAILRHLMQTTAFGGETRQDVGVIGTTAERIGFGKIVPLLQTLKTLSMIDEIKTETGEDYEDISLVFGSWLTPYFYVSYGKDLTKESGMFTTRYTLGKGFSFETETGASQSGGDIKYEFEH